MSEFSIFRETMYRRVVSCHVACQCQYYLANRCHGKHKALSKKFNIHDNKNDNLKSARIKGSTIAKSKSAD